MAAAVWSTDPDKAGLEFPVLTLVRFLWVPQCGSGVSSTVMFPLTAGQVESPLAVDSGEASGLAYHSRRSPEVHRCRDPGCTTGPCAAKLAGALYHKRPGWGAFDYTSTVVGPRSTTTSS